ncbi:primosomal protein DnaI [Bacillus fonticola]|uniref:primosomal protein DnaI n=1 Tax=Bacillus fonticola TaxID=2728853 RepID=UPI0014729DEC|nr:primosomal protein DnaI [Bacillus fonticola]
MKNIRGALSKFQTSHDFRQRYEQLKQEVLQHPDIVAFLQERQEDVTEDMIERAFPKLLEYSQQSKACADCASYETCKNMMPGYDPMLTIDKGNITLQYDECPRKRLADARAEQQSLIKSFHIPKRALQATFASLDLDDGRRFQGIRLAHEFVNAYPDQPRGLYLYGKFGVGKTHLLAAIAHELAENHNVSSVLVHVPEFIREIKQSIGKEDFSNKLALLRETPVLMLDDIGAESMSSWARDEVLGTILQYRTLEQLPTFFTSNFDLEQLEHHLTFSQRGEEEVIKASRLIDRVQALAIPVEMSGKNRRRS